MVQTAVKNRGRSPTMRILGRFLLFSTALLVCKVFVAVLLGYGDYFPANLESDFLILRAEDFRGLYRFAFYTHIITAPFLFLAMTLQLNSWFLKHYRRMHRVLGRICVLIGIFCFVPSSIYMAHYSFAGWIATAGFYGGSIGLGLSLTASWRFALRRDFQRHRLWNMRAYLFMLSAVVLRLIGGLTVRMELPQIPMYQFAAWGSWLMPLLAQQGILALKSHKVSSATISLPCMVPIEPQAPNGEGESISSSSTEASEIPQSIKSLMKQTEPSTLDALIPRS